MYVGDRGLRVSTPPWIVLGLVGGSALACACSSTVVKQSGSTGAGGANTTSASATTGTSGAATGSSTGTGSVTSTNSSSATGGSATYSAFALATNLPRYVVFKSEPAANRCVELMVSASGGPGIGIQTPMGWTVDQALVTAHASDCALDASGYPIITMMSTSANGAMGTLDHQPTGFAPCHVTVHATVTFPTGSPWAPPTDSLDVDNLLIQATPGC